MPFNYNRVTVFMVESLTEAEQRLGQQYSLSTGAYQYLLQQFRDGLDRGYGFPSFVSGGSVVEVRPSLAYLLRYKNTKALRQE